jgi:hypothetical protein
MVFLFFRIINYPAKWQLNIFENDLIFCSEDFVNDNCNVLKHHEIKHFKYKTLEVSKSQLDSLIT